MNDYLIVIGFAVLWALTVLGAYGSGRVRGHDAAREEMRWAHWMMRRSENRSRRI